MNCPIDSDCISGVILDLRGDRQPINSATILRETFVSGVVRAILDDNEEVIETSNCGRAESNLEERKRLSKNIFIS